ncbi:hypothetical protein LTR67_001958 [Exophiala xenobiotica]
MSMKIQMPENKEDSIVETTVHLVGDMKKLDMGIRVDMKVQVRGLSKESLDKVVNKAKESRDKGQCHDEYRGGAGIRINDDLGVQWGPPRNERAGHMQVMLWNGMECEMRFHEEVLKYYALRTE